MPAFRTVLEKVTDFYRTRRGDLQEFGDKLLEVLGQLQPPRDATSGALSREPLLGLRATTDTRLGTITLVGDPAIVSIAEQYLKKLDLRQRQVALNVRILDLNLDNLSEFDNSFAFRWGNNFIVNDNGQLLGAFGRDLPPEASAFRRDVPREIQLEDGNFTVEGGAGGLGLAAESSALTVQARRVRSIDSNVLRRVQRETKAQLVPSVDPVTGRVSYAVVPQPGTSSRFVTREIERLLGNEVSIQRGSAQGTISGVARNPVNNYSDTFFDFVRAQIVSGSTKLLASPTLILQDNPSLLREGSEGAASGGQQSGDQSASQGITNIGLDSAIGRRRANEGVVRVGTNVVTGYETETPAQGGNVVCTPQLTTAGLVLGARVEKIDDNGFVTFTLSPSVSAITGQEDPPEGCGSPLNILSVRSLDTGALRVRDGQTLIMTGVISELDRQVVTKWPILGDIPLIGQFFRSTSGRKEKRELVIMVTPRIVNDEQGGVYGYGYQPGTAAGRDFFGTAILGGGAN
jgi:type IV pilus assembly protein PilQ